MENVREVLPGLWWPAQCRLALSICVRRQIRFSLALDGNEKFSAHLHLRLVENSSKVGVCRAQWLQKQCTCQNHFPNPNHTVHLVGEVANSARNLAVLGNSVDFWPRLDMVPKFPRLLCRGFTKISDGHWSSLYLLITTPMGNVSMRSL